MAKHDGGPAFPNPAGCFGGMSLRDYFAIHILAAMVASARVDGINVALPEQEAITAYDWADAMLKEREK